jgi:hypothetical protein
MPLTAAAVINAARDVHPSLTPEYAPSAVGWRFLSRWQRELLVELTRLVPEFSNSTKSVPIAASAFTTGIDLLQAAPTLLWPAGVLEVKRVVATVAAQPTFYGQRTVDILPFLSELKQFSVPTAVLENGTTLRLLGETQDWSAYDTLAITVTPTPDNLTANESVLALPDDATSAASLALAAFYAQRLSGDPALKVSPASVGALQGQAMDARQMFLNRVQQQQSRQPIRILETW